MDKVVWKLKIGCFLTSVEFVSRLKIEQEMNENRKKMVHCIGCHLKHECYCMLAFLWILIEEEPTA